MHTWIEEEAVEGTVAAARPSRISASRRRRHRVHDTAGSVCRTGIHSIWVPVRRAPVEAVHQLPSARDDKAVGDRVGRTPRMWDTGDRNAGLWP